MPKLLKQMGKFILTSGIGWIIDFSIYLIIIKYFSKTVGYANIISAIPATTFVFFLSVKKNFQKKESKLSINKKYIIYIIYQIILVVGVSYLGQRLYDYFLLQQENLPVFIFCNLKIIVKIMITPITMIINFLVMKSLIEKI